MKYACKEIARLASESLERQLTRWERVKFQLHIWMCSNCKNHAGNLKIMHQACRLMQKSQYGDVKLSDQQRQTLLERLKEQTK